MQPGPLPSKRWAPRRPVLLLGQELKSSQVLHHLGPIRNNYLINKRKWLLWISVKKQKTDTYRTSNPTEALSVSISQRTSPALRESPAALFHAAMVPLVMVGLKDGIKSLFISFTVY